MSMRFGTIIPSDALGMPTVPRDVKSSNILLTAEGVPKVSDVGHSVMVDYLSSGVKTAGTFAYAAPELLMGSNCTLKVGIIHTCASYVYLYILYIIYNIYIFIIH